MKSELFKNMDHWCERYFTSQGKGVERSINVCV